MSLSAFDNYLKFAEEVVAAKAELPDAIGSAELESALVSHGVVLLHSHMEQCIRSALETRCARCTDHETRNFALSVKDEKTGKIGIHYLKETLRRFSNSYRTKFKSNIDGSGLVDPPPSWESVKNQRKIVAHEGQPARCSLSDLRIYYEDVRKVLGYFCDSLELSPTETADISPLIVHPSESSGPSGENASE